VLSYRDLNKNNKYIQDHNEIKEITKQKLYFRVKYIKIVLFFKIQFQT